MSQVWLKRGSTALKSTILLRKQLEKPQLPSPLTQKVSYVHYSLHVTFIRTESLQQSKTSILLRFG